MSCVETLIFVTTCFPASSRGFSLFILSNRRIFTETLTGTFYLSVYLKHSNTHAVFNFFFLLVISQHSCFTFAQRDQSQSQLLFHPVRSHRARIVFFFFFALSWSHMNLVLMFLLPSRWKTDSANEERNEETNLPVVMTRLLEVKYGSDWEIAESFQNDKGSLRSFGEDILII